VNSRLEQELKSSRQKTTDAEKQAFLLKEANQAGKQ
jgi:hypothetical protein